MSYTVKKFNRGTLTYTKGFSFVFPSTGKTFANRDDQTVQIVDSGPRVAALGNGATVTIKPYCVLSISANGMLLGLYMRYSSWDISDWFYTFNTLKKRKKNLVIQVNINLLDSWIVWVTVGNLLLWSYAQSKSVSYEHIQKKQVQLKQ